MDRTVTTQGAGRGSAAPDAAEAVLSVEVEAATPADALRGCGEVQRRVLEALGVQAASSGLSVTPGWDHSTQQSGRPMARARLVATLPFATAGDVVTAALEAGGRETQLQSLQPVVTDTSAAVVQARAEAFEDARRAAEQYAALAGLRLGSVVTVTESSPESVAVFAKRTSGRTGGYELADGEQDTTVGVVVSWELLGG